MADFLNDYSGIAGAGSAFGSFAQAFSEAQDKKMKRLQQQAEMFALQTRLAREGVAQQMTLAKEGLSTQAPPPGPPQPVAATPSIDNAQSGGLIGSQEGLVPKGILTGNVEDAFNSADSQANEMPTPAKPLVAASGGSPALYASALPPKEQHAQDHADFVAGSDTDPATGRINMRADTPTVVNAKAKQDLAKGAQAIAGKRLDLMGKRFEEVQDQHAQAAGKAIDTNKLVSDLTSSRQSLARARSLLIGEMPLTYKNLNAAQMDIISALSKGGVSSEGKVDREMQKSWEGEWNNLLAKAGKYKDNDIRKQDPGLYNQIRAFLEEVDSSVAKNLASHVKTLSTSYGQTSNDKTRRIIEGKVKQYGAPQETEGQQPPSSLLSPEKQKRLDELNAKAGIR